MRNPVAVLAAAAALAGGAFFVGCGEDTVPNDKIQEEAQKQFDKLAQDQGQESFPEISCPDDLKAEKGQTTKCTAEGPEGPIEITVTVREVKDGTAQLNFNAQ